VDFAGLVGFSTCDSFVSRSIRYFTGGMWSHTFLCLGNIRGKELVLEASTYEVRIAPFSRFLTEGTKLAIVKPSITDWSLHIAMMDKATDMVGRGYGYAQLIGYIWPWLLHRVGIKASNPFHDGVVCSELVGAEQLEAGYTYLQGTKVNDITPDSLWDCYFSDKISRVMATKDYGKVALNVLQGVQYGQ
jgi:hypothetical protein